MDGNQARLVVNGIDYSLNRRGINMIVVDPGTFDVRSASFDTHTFSADENARLQEFIADASRRPGCPFAIAVKDDGATNLSPDSKAALESLGVRLPSSDHAAVLDALLNERSHVLPPRETAILLNVCARANAPACIEVLARRGWNVNACAPNGLQGTPLHDAVRRGHLEAIKTLMRLGADHLAYNRDRRSPDDIARAVHKCASVSDMIRVKTARDGEFVESVLRALDL